MKPTDLRGILQYIPQFREKTFVLAIDGAIVTDGVSASFQFSKVVMVSEEAALDAATGKRKKKPVAGKKIAGALTAVEDYPRNQSSLVRRAGDHRLCIVLGLDPGRAALATISYHLNDTQRAEFPKAWDNHKPRSWSLSRDMYYKDSGIAKISRRHAGWYKHLETTWREMGRVGSLRTLSLSDIEAYLKLYLQIQAEWWHLALKWRESRDSFQRYIGKRSVLDRFFTAVDKEAAELFPDAEVLLAYGSAGVKMKSNGKGELSVPTTGSYKAAVRRFKDRLKVEDESYSTKVDFTSGQVKHAVYRAPVIGEDGNVQSWKMAFTTEKCPPVPTPEHRAAVEEFLKQRTEARRLKRTIGAGSTRKSDRVDDEEGRPVQLDRLQASPPRALRYPEIRGLRSLQGERTVFVNRDKSAACAISSRLHAMKLEAGRNVRPAPFCRRCSSK